MRDEEQAPCANEIASAPLRSTAALTRAYARTRRLLHSVNAASVMSSSIIPASCWVELSSAACEAPKIRTDQSPRRPLPRLLRVAGRIDERTSARPGAAHLDDHRLAHLDEMSDVGGLG